MPEWQGSTITDPKVMRALAHPARIAIMEHLSATEVGATATGCARVSGLSPSATSYHLRELAKVGLVEEAPGRGDGRERVWRAALQSWRVDAGRSAAPEVRAAETTLVEAYLARELDRVRGWLRRAGDEPQEWYDAALLSESVLLVTADELAELNAAFLKMLEPYKKRRRSADPPDGARTVAVQYKSLPLET